MAEAERGPLNKLAILIGVAICIIGSLVVTLGAFLIGIIIVGAKGQQADGLLDAWMQETQVLVVLLLVGGAWLIVGGFTAAKIAKRDHVLHAAWTGVIMMAFSALIVLLPDDGPPLPFWSDAVSTVINVPAAMFGGWLARPGANSER